MALYSPNCYSVELPLPPKACSPNFSGHTKWRAKPIAAYRAECKARLLSARLPLLRPPVTVHLEYYLSRKVNGHPVRGRYYPRDEDNAIGGAKAAKDALQDAGVVPVDTRRYVRVGEVRIYSRAKEHQGRACLVLWIEGSVE